MQPKQPQTLRRTKRWNLFWAITYFEEEKPVIFFLLISQGKMVENGSLMWSTNGIFWVIIFHSHQSRLLVPVLGVRRHVFVCQGEFLGRGACLKGGKPKNWLFLGFGHLHWPGAQTFSAMCSPQGGSDLGALLQSTPSTPGVGRFQPGLVTAGLCTGTPARSPPHCIWNIFAFGVNGADFRQRYHRHQGTHAWFFLLLFFGDRMPGNDIPGPAFGRSNLSGMPLLVNTLSNELFWCHHPGSSHTLLPSRMAQPHQPGPQLMWM